MVKQSTYYPFRPLKLEGWNFLEFACQWKKAAIRQNRQQAPDNGVLEGDSSGAGGHGNARLERHPQACTHVLQLRSLQCVPLWAGQNVPDRPVSELSNGGMPRTIMASTF